MTTWTFDSLTEQSAQSLDEIFLKGTRPKLSAIAGWEYRGLNVVPWHTRPIARAAGIMRFIKCFVQPSGEPPPDEAKHIYGYNLTVTRGGKREPWTCRPDDTHPGRQGYYHVYPQRIKGRVDEYPHAIFLDYDIEPNNLFSGRTLEDYVVQIDERADLLLGKAYFNLGPIRSPNFFVLERLQEHTRTPR